MSKLRYNYDRTADPLLAQMEALNVTIEAASACIEQITPEITLINGRAKISERLKAEIRSKHGADKS